ncbi:MAG: BlaI/MecI/CopY family transcriptional regulator [Spirosomaceae bacterium]|jgi:BlaI family transcriptional regulator, penicillinase repressor|nr:BlaI/MecI/CopY family transcriptional regulator [Spirosomataceae bacterium]
MDTIRDLTKAEEEIMQILWDIEQGVVWDVIERLPEPKPAYNTVSTFIRILEQKGFIDHRALSGKTYEYFPLISREDYRAYEANKLVNNYFDGSLKELVSFFVQDKNLSMRDADEIIKMLQNAQ